MPELRVLSGRDVCRLLAEHGFAEVRQRGSHIIMQKQDLAGTTTIPVPNHRELKRGTLLSIIRQSRLPRALFEIEN